MGEAEPIVLALSEEATPMDVDDKNGINACKLLGISFTTAIGILIRTLEKELLTRQEVLEKCFSVLADSLISWRYTRYPGHPKGGQVSWSWCLPPPLQMRRRISHRFSHQAVEALARLPAIRLNRASPAGLIVDFLSAPTFVDALA
jgi:hypothetical protein